MRGLLERLRAGEILVADGATGTLLQQRGLGRGECPEEWNVSHPEVVASVARDYAAAGSDLVYTNTFGGNRLRLAAYGLEGRVEELNRRGAEIARKAVGNEVFVVGSMGPTGEFLEPLGTHTFAEMVEIFAEQAQALAEGGVDAIVVETFSALEEIKAAAQGVKESTGLPLLGSMSFDPNGRTSFGVRPEQAVAALVEAGAEVVGANCGGGPAELEPVAEKMRTANPDLLLLVKPNAGLPRLVRGEVYYPLTPAEMGEYARRFAALGVNILGGCCGTTPEHIAAIVQALK